MSKQIDSYNLPMKLEIRRRLLAAFPKRRPISVLDCCAGERGEIWKALRREFPGRIRYMGLDQKAVGHGIVQFDSVRWLQEVEWSADVVDIDTYGEPWAHYHAAVDRGLPRLTVFLTFGFPNIAQLGSPSVTMCEMIGIPGAWRKRLDGNVSGGLLDWSRPPERLRDLMLREALAYPLRRGYEVERCLQVRTGCHNSTFYWALRLRRLGKNPRGK